MSISFPPIDFPIFGMDDGWTGPRWLEFVEGKRGSPAWGVWLGHRHELRQTHGCPWSSVITFSRVRHARVMAGAQGDPDRALAFAAAFALINMTMPDRTGRDPALPGALVDRAQREADRLDDWQTTHWLIDGHTTVARIWPWADAWAGLAAVSTAVAVVVLGHGLDPASVRLSEVHDTSTYNFAKDQPLQFPGTMDASREAALTQATGLPDAAWPWHHDHNNPGKD